jgi:hypothetical protein
MTSKDMTSGKEAGGIKNILKHFSNFGMQRNGHTEHLICVENSKKVKKSAHPTVQSIG